MFESEGQSSDNDGEINVPFDNVYENGSDSFSDTDFIDREAIIREDAGVRGPRSISIVYPHDGKKLVQVCRGIKGIQEFDSNMNSFQMESLREEAKFVHEDVFNM